jgi:hypothetical protein
VILQVVRIATQFLREITRRRLSLCELEISVLVPSLPFICRPQRKKLRIMSFAHRKRVPRSDSRLAALAFGIDKTPVHRNSRSTASVYIDPEICPLIGPHGRQARVDL